MGKMEKNMKTIIEMFWESCRCRMSRSYEILTGLGRELEREVQEEVLIKK